jgi:hypothetical protein
VAGNIASPEPAATAVLREVKLRRWLPRTEISEDAEPTEAAIATRGVKPENVDKGAEQATTPASGAQPNMLGQAETGETGLGTVEPSVFVNLRDRPSSSSPVLGVVAKGTKLPVLDRKRGWVQVTDPASGKEGWIYGGLLAGEAKTHYRRSRGSRGSGTRDEFGIVLGQSRALADTGLVQLTFSASMPWLYERDRAGLLRPFAGPHWPASLVRWRRVRA